MVRRCSRVPAEPGGEACLPLTCTPESDVARSRDAVRLVPLAGVEPAELPALNRTTLPVCPQGRGVVRAAGLEPALTGA